MGLDQHKKKRIFIIAPGMPFDQAQLKKSLKIIAGWGFEVLKPHDLLKKNHPVCSADRKTRWQHLSQALLAKNCDIIWAVRGGYGSLHLIPELEQFKKPQHPKRLIGFSDITTLHLFLNQKWGWETWHGPHLDRLHALSPQRQKQIYKLLTGETKNIVFRSLKPMNAAARKSSQIKGSVIGGNLVTLQSSLGTKSTLQAQGKILFVEDIGERGYRVDRVLEHFTQAGVWRGIRALIFGPFVGGQEPSGKDLTQKVLQEFSEKQSFPIYSGVQSGHIANSLVLPFGTHAVLQKQGRSFDLNVSVGEDS
jgi:muramoyltetrapeptide carboxypeptidase